MIFPLAETSTTAPALAGDDLQALWQQIGLGRSLAETPWWGWLALAGCVFAGFAAGKVVRWVCDRAADRAAGRGWTQRAILARSIGGPAVLAAFTIALTVGLGWIAMEDALRLFAFRVLRLLLVVAIGWFAWNLVELVEHYARRLTARTRSPLDDQLVPLLRKTLRVVLVVMLALFVAENIFNANVTSFLAGLGIAGLAVSLAAQDTLKNFFGSVTIFVDQPFNVGDRVTIAGYDGTVEEIGFRSTKVRTLTGHLVTIPNSKVVDSSVENIARRPNIRRMFVLNVTYDTPPEKLRQAVQIVKDVLNDPEIAAAWDMEKLPPRVIFDEFGAASLNIRVLYWFHPAVDWWAYMAHAERINLMLLERFNAAGIDFAFPTQTIHVAGDARRSALQVAMQSTDQATAPAAR